MHTSEVAGLAQKAQQGDKAAFSALYEQFIKPIYNFIYYKTHHKETAEDLTSQTFMKAYNKIGTFAPDKGPFTAWLYQIARNAVVDHYRTLKPTKDIEDVFDLAGSEDVERDAHVKIELAKVEEYLRELTAEQREIVTLRLWQELSYAEIAVIVGKSEASCKMMFSRTIGKLREVMPATLFALLLITKL